MTVIFLGDNGRTAQMHHNRIIPFNGTEQYWLYANEQKLLKNLNSKDFQKNFVSRSKLWTMAVNEAEILQLVPIPMSIDIYNRALLPVM